MENTGINRNKALILLTVAIIIAVTVAIRIFSPAIVYGNTRQVSPKVAILYKKASKEYTAGNLSAAYKTVKFILNNYYTGKILSSNIDYLYGKILYKYKDFFMAKPYFQRIIVNDPNYKKIYRAIFYMARCDFNMKNYKRSIRDFSFLLNKNKKGSNLYNKSLVYLTLSYASFGNIKEANKFYEKDNVKNILKKIIYLEKRNNYFKLIYLNYLINRKDDLSTALLILNNKNLFSPKKKYICYKPYYSGIIALKKNEYRTAQNYFAESSSYCTGYYRKSSLIYYGISLVEQKDFSGIGYIKNRLSTEGFLNIKLMALKFLAKFYKKHDKPEISLDYLKRILFDNNAMHKKERGLYEKEAAGLLYKVIKKDYENNNFRACFSIFKRMKFLIPNTYINPKIYLYLFKIKAKEKKYKDALPYAEKYNSLMKNAVSEYYISNVYYALKKYPKSILLMNKINSKNVKNIKLRNKIINLKLKLYKQLNYKNNYITLLKRSLSLLPPIDNINSLYFLGRNEFNKNNLKTAATYFDRLIKIVKNNKNVLYDTYYYLGLINYKFNDYNLSLLYFKEGYDINRTGKYFQYELSQIAFIYLKYLRNKTLSLKYYNILSTDAVSITYKNLASSMIFAANLQK